MIYISQTSNSFVDQDAKIDSSDFSLRNLRDNYIQLVQYTWKEHSFDVVARFIHCHQSCGF